jgi:hypothetical protein
LNVKDVNPFSTEMSEKPKSEAILFHITGGAKPYAPDPAPGKPVKQPFRSGGASLPTRDDSLVRGIGDAATLVKGHVLSAPGQGSSQICRPGFHAACDVP